MPSAQINHVSLWGIIRMASCWQNCETEEPVSSIHDFVPEYLKLVEAEEKWLASHTQERIRMLKNLNLSKRKLPLFRKVQYPEQTKTIQDETYVIREIVGEDIKELLQVERLVYAGELPWTKSAFLSEIYSRFKHLYLCILQNERMIGFAGVRLLGRRCSYYQYCCYT